MIRTIDISRWILCFIFFVFIILGGVQPSTHAGNYPLEILNIKPIGVDGMTERNRIFHAYPGIEYNIRVAVVGGSYPYTFSFSKNKPSWLHINPKTGEIWGIAPSSGSFDDIEIKVTDSEDSSVTATWGITVTDSTNYFVFVAPYGNDSDDGTITHPWKTIGHLYKDQSGTWYGSNHPYPNRILYLRAGVYTLPNNKAGYSDRVDGLSVWTSSPLQWIAYPGESVTVDFQDLKLEKRWRVSHQYFDRIIFRNMTGVGIHDYSSSSYVTYRRCTFRDIVSPNTTNGNYGFIHTTSDRGASNGEFNVIQDCKFYDFGGTATIGSIYRWSKFLIEDNEIYNCFDGPGNLESAIVIKATTDHVTIRHNYVHDMHGFSILGNYTNGVWNRCNNTEICFNRFIADSESDPCIAFNAHSCQGLTYFYRNTIVGKVLFYWLDNGTPGNPHENSTKDNGPFYVNDNVIINTNNLDPNHFSYSHCGNSIADELFVNSSNLVGSHKSDILQDDGDLNSSHADFVGLKGYQIEREQNGEAPTAPSSLRKVAQ